jgi:xanthine dehydrogenase YagR molybdenum-binding subunit
MDPLDLMLKNIALTAPPEDTYHRADTYRDELMIAADLIGWKKNWHPRGQGSGTTKRGLGLAIHTWGGRGHESNCALTIYPTGSVEIQMGTQDLGVGTRTAILIVAGDTLGLQLNQIELKVAAPPSAASALPRGAQLLTPAISSSPRSLPL